ncbi:MAG: hypothetical protein IJO36_04780 [Clostridia bacterium]|nr:hypothetical protein [Clostridia bacterium]
MQELEFSVIFNEQQKQSSEITADDDLFNEVVSIIAEQTIYNNIENNN